MVLSDGPHGLRVQDPEEGDHLGLGGSLPATCFPTAAAVANSWDETLGEAIGEALAEEAVSMGVHVILGPGMNIKRSPLCGRNFEYFSEDPYHTGKMAASYIRGIQKKGVSACPKHFAANSQELRRMASNSVLDERTFREIYTTAFEIAVKEAKPHMLMSSYNEINGVYANENAHLLQEILVQEWGFEGCVVSDWGGSNDHALGVKNGSHLEMPGTGRNGQKEILKAIQEGRLTEQELDQRLDELLDVIFMLAQKQQKVQKGSFDIQAHHALARRAAEESIVLLKNEGNVLPLAPKTKVAVIGEFAKEPRYQGAGSSLVNPTQAPETILDGIEACGLHMVSFAQGYKRNEKSDRNLMETAVQLSKDAEVILVFAGLDEINEAEGMDRSSMKMPAAQEELIETLTEKYDNVVVVLSAGSAVEMPWAKKCRAIVHGYLGGQAGASAMLNVLTGRVNPSGRLNETYPFKYEDTPAFAYYPGKERTSEYREGTYVGYRYYTTVGAPVAYPFGFGLSYTTFAYKNLTVKENEVRFTLQNTGHREGTEIPQVYIGKQSDTVFRPVKELKGFQRVTLKAGEEKEVVIPLDDKAFRFYDTRTDTWEIESGRYHIMVGRNAENVELETDLQICGTVENGGYRKEELPHYFSGKIKNVDLQEFTALYGRGVPDGGWSGEIGINDAFCQFYYAKSPLARLVYKVLNHLLEKSRKTGKPDLNLMFIYNMPIRGVSKMTGDLVNQEMVWGIAEMANGHTWKGLRNIIKGFFSR